MMHKLLKRPQAIIGLCLIAIVIVIAIAAPAFSPHDPELVNLSQKYAQPDAEYQELKKEVQPYLDAVKLAPEKVRAFLDAILTRTRQTRQHDQPSRRKSQDIEL